jgi:hypothetical protein
VVAELGEALLQHCAADGGKEPGDVPAVVIEGGLETEMAVAVDLPLVTTAKSLLSRSESPHPGNVALGGFLDHRRGRIHRSQAAHRHGAIERRPLRRRIDPGCGVTQRVGGMGEAGRGLQ